MFMKWQSWKHAFNAKDMNPLAYWIIERTATDVERLQPRVDRIDKNHAEQKA